nr:hypothetical protein [Brevibacillus laterosporus]
MSEETQMSQNQLAILALYGLLSNWNVRKDEIFAGLLNISRKKRGGL